MIGSQTGQFRVVERLGAPDARPIPETEGAKNPFFSPDGRALGFVVAGAMRRIELAGGAPRTVVELDDGGFMGPPSWGPDGSILYAVTSGAAPGVYRVDASGDEPVRLTGPEDTPGRSLLGWVDGLGGHEGFLFVAVGEGGARVA